MESFVAVENGEVRGGYEVKHQPFVLNGVLSDDVRNLQLPLSEGTVDPAYRMIGVQLLASAQRTNPLLYALGMGGIETPLPRMLKAMGWTTLLVPFFFRVVHARQFLRNIRVLRTTPMRRTTLDVAAATGLGALAFRAMHGARTVARINNVTAATVPRFDAWADAIWERAHGAYSLIALRDSIELNALYAENDPKPMRLRVQSSGRDIGWAIVFDTSFADHKQFGAIRLGSLIDCLALPGEEAGVVDAATRHLIERGVDLVISNQSHLAWRDGLVRAGYLNGPSNYGFAASKALVAALAPWQRAIERVHLTRGDGDGPIHH
jgi:hypothetical protein